ncbi:MAG TPA: zinc-binding dehydrogenase [Anaeromyxobacteraceae bacterium]|nr:zinc-binding dehydrogenase [Anaeromyxobacteraceae bacterium]
MTQNRSTYRAIRFTGPGGLDRLEEVRLPLLDPGPGELRVRVVAAGAGATDLTMRRGRYPFAPPFPFVPGYEVLGVVDAIGAGVVGFALGQKVAALTVHGAFAEYLVRAAEHFVPVPAGLDDGETVALVLNYGTAWQMIHRVAKLQAGQTALVTGANGGVGTALLDLLRDARVRTLGACSSRHAELVRSLGGEPIPSRGTPLDRTVRSVLPEGVDAAFDVLGGAGTGECIRATKRGGVVVGYGFMGTVVDGRPSRWLTLRGFASLLVGARLHGRRGAFYGITLRYRRDPGPYREDLASLMTLLASRRIAPRIAHRLPLLAVRRSQELLEAGGIAGKIVLVREAGLGGRSEGGR